MQVRWTDTASAAAGPALQQSRCYGLAAAGLGAEVRHARITAGTARGGALVVIRRFGVWPRVALISRGPVWDGPTPEPRVRRAALAAIRRGLPGGGFLVVTPEDPTPGLIPLVTPNHLADWSLGPDIARLRAGLDGKWRNRLVRAERSGAEPRLIRPDAGDLARLCARDRAQGRRRGYRNLPLGFLEAWRAVGGDMLLAQLVVDNRTLAEMLFLGHPPGATYQIGWTGAEGRALCAHHLLVWRAAVHFARAGVVRLDLGSLDTVNAPGLARFKLATGARHRALGPTGLVAAWR